MTRRRESVVGGIATVTGLGLVLTTHVLRSLTRPRGTIASVVLGSLPNFGAGLGLPFLMGSTQELLGRPLPSGRTFNLVCGGVFTVLALWEYAQLAFWGHAFDLNDIVASGIGVALAAQIAALGRRKSSAGFRS